MINKLLSAAKGYLMQNSARRENALRKVISELEDIQKGPCPDCDNYEETELLTTAECQKCSACRDLTDT